MVLQIADRRPAECADGDHNHDGDQGCHRNLFYPVSQYDNHEQQENTGAETRQPPPSAGFHVDDRLADHGAACHPADKPGCGIGETLSDAFAVLVAGGVGEFIDDGCRHQRFQQAHGGDGGRVGQDDHQGFQRQRDIGDQEHGQGGWQLAHIADGADIEAEEDRNDGQNNDADQRRWHGLRQIWEQVDDPEPGGDHRIGQPRNADKLGQLRHENQDRERVDETRHYRARHEPHDIAEMQEPGDDLQQPGKHSRREQVLQAVFLDQGDHEDGGCRSGRGNHTRASARNGDDDGDRERRVEPDLGIHAGDNRKRDCFGDQRERNDKTGEDIAADVPEPLVPVRME